jgi:hypothetical protein
MTTPNELTTVSNRLVGITSVNVLFITRSDRSGSETATASLSIHEHAELVEILARTLFERLDADSRLG